MNTKNDEIVINEEALSLVNKSTLELKAKLTAILDNMSQANKTFCADSSGDFADAFGEVAMNFEKKMSEYIATLNEVNKFAEDTFQLQTEQDAELASSLLK